MDCRAFARLVEAEDAARAVVLAGAARLSGMGVAQNADAATVATLELRFEDLADGGLTPARGLRPPRARGCSVPAAAGSKES